jgi:hypothetical protein
MQRCTKVFGMGLEPLYCNPYNPRMLSVVVAPGYRQDPLETIEDKTASEIVHDRLSHLGHEKRTI